MFPRTLIPILSIAAVVISSTLAQTVNCDPGTQSASTCFGGTFFNDQFCAIIGQIPFVAGGAISYCIGSDGFRCDYTAFNTGSSGLQPTFDSCASAIGTLGIVCGDQGGRVVDGPSDPMAYTVRGNIGSCASDIVGS